MGKGFAEKPSLEFRTYSSVEILTSLLAVL